MKKLFCFFLIIFIFISLPSLAIGQDNLIYIKENGTVEGTDKIQRDGAIYTLTKAILGKRVIVEKSNITIDGNGALLGNYNGFEGVINLNNVKNVVIKNCLIKNCVYGIELNSSSDITILGNKISEADMSMFWPAAAIHIMYETSNINLIGNDITNNKWGIIHCIEESPNLVIHHNNFVENYEKDVSILPEFSATWDDGKEGNYWSKYNGADSNGDGIGDTPYSIDDNNQDNYPLMQPVETQAIPEFSSLIFVLLLLFPAIFGIIIRIRLKGRINEEN
ncbi:MAG: NosD domain-containing protein [Candidatus Bathyarchaeota archaeon]